MCGFIGTSTAITAKNASNCTFVGLQSTKLPNGPIIPFAIVFWWIFRMLMLCTIHLQIAPMLSLIRICLIQKANILIQKKNYLTVGVILLLMQNGYKVNFKNRDMRNI